MEKGVALFGLYLVALVSAGVGNLLIRIGTEAGWLPPGGRIALALIATGPLIFAVVKFWRLLRDGLDEMLQRIVVEGMAFAMVLYLPIVALYVNLRTAGVWTFRLDPPDILMAPALLVAIGIAIAKRRYE